MKKVLNSGLSVFVGLMLYRWFIALYTLGSQYFSGGTVQIDTLGLFLMEILIGLGVIYIFNRYTYETVASEITSVTPLEIATVKETPESNN